MSFASLSMLLFFYFLLGLAIPRLPLVGSRKRAVVALGLTFVCVVVFGALGSASMSPEEKAAMEAKATARRQNAEAEALARKVEAEEQERRRGPERLVANVQAALGRSNRDGPEPKVDFADDGTLSIKWAINENLTENMTKRGAQIDVVNVLKAAHAANVPITVVRLEGSFSLVDKFGNSSETQVLRLTYNAATINRFNFENFLTQNVYTVADSSWIHPAFR
jgi:hypothetical protein